MNIDEINALSPEELKARYIELATDNETLVTVVVDVCKLLDILPYKESDNILKKFLKRAGHFIMRSTLDPKGVAKEFECVLYLLPLMNKYVDENGNIIKKY